MSYSTSVVKTKIKEKLAEVLPALLTAAGLDDFDDYLDDQPSKPDAVQLGVYVDTEIDIVDSHSLTIIIQAQLYRKGFKQDAYHAVLMPALRKYITAYLVDYTTRESITADLWPVDKNASSFSFYVIEFSEDLDDCDDGGYYTDPEEEPEEPED